MKKVILLSAFAAISCALFAQNDQQPTSSFVKHQDELALKTPLLHRGTAEKSEAGIILSFWNNQFGDLVTILPMNEVTKKMEFGERYEVRYSSVTVSDTLPNGQVTQVDEYKIVLATQLVRCVPVEIQGILDNETTITLKGKDAEDYIFLKRAYEQGLLRPVSVNNYNYQEAMPQVQLN